jgi:hypothetical protein
MYLDDSFADEGSREKGVERYTKMTASDASQIEEGIGNGCTAKDSPETVFLHIIVDNYLSSLHKC